MGHVWDNVVESDRNDHGLRGSGTAMENEVFHLAPMEVPDDVSDYEVTESDPDFDDDDDEDDDDDDEWDEYSNEHFDDFESFDNGMNAFKNSTELDPEGRGHRGLARELCGCETINFNTDGKGRPIHGTPYIVHHEWEDRYGFRVRVKADTTDGGYAPDRRARLYDTSLRVTNDEMGDRELGSPNEKCSTPGPGIGKGGEPRTSSGAVNWGMNCRPQGKVLIIQNVKSMAAKANKRGGEIEIFFTRGPVRLEAMELFDMDNQHNGRVRVFYGDKRTKKTLHKKYKSKGYGKNSINPIVIKRDNVHRLRVTFADTGAINAFRICHEKKVCTSPRTNSAGNKNLTPHQQKVENFRKEVKPHIEAEAIHKITSALREASSKSKDFCLSPTEATVDVDMMVSDKNTNVCKKD